MLYTDYQKVKKFKADQILHLKDRIHLLEEVLNYSQLQLLKNPQNYAISKGRPILKRGLQQVETPMTQMTLQEKSLTMMIDGQTEEEGQTKAEGQTKRKKLKKQTDQ